MNAEKVIKLRKDCALTSVIASKILKVNLATRQPKCRFGFRQDLVGKLRIIQKTQPLTLILFGNYFFSASNTYMKDCKKLSFCSERPKRRIFGSLTNHSLVYVMANYN